MLPTNLGICSPRRIFQKDVFEPVSLGIVSAESAFQKDAEIEEIIDTNLQILKSIKLPDHFAYDEVTAFIEKMIRDGIKDDPTHKQTIELNKYAKDFRKYFHEYYSKIFAFHKQLNEDAHNFVFIASNLYLKSDFPPSFIRTLSFSLLTDVRFNNIYDMMIHREKLDLINSYNNAKKFKRVCVTHNNWAVPLATMGENISKLRVGLIWYIEFNNSRKLEEVFQPKTFKIKLIDQEYFFGTLVRLQQETDRLRRELVNLNREAFGTIPTRENSTTNMLSNVMEIMSS